MLRQREFFQEIGMLNRSLPWRGNNGTKKVIYTMREVDLSESPPPPPPPARIPLTLWTGDSAANNATRHPTPEEQDDKTEHTLKSVHDLVHKINFQEEASRYSFKWHQRNCKSH
jgi:hypothetical protein